MEESLQVILPPVRESASGATAPKRFRVERIGKSFFRAFQDEGEFIAEGENPKLVLHTVDTWIRMHISSEAPEHVFVHAGAVAVDGIALILPGPSFAGKSTLVAALVRAGGTYLSDEYAVLDRDGRVAAYPRAISIRIPETSSSVEIEPANLGRVASDRLLPVGVVALTEFRPGARWAPERPSPGVGALGVFKHAVTAVTRPEDSLDAIRHAVDGAVVLEGPRGEAVETAPALIDELKAQAALVHRSSSASS